MSGGSTRECAARADRPFHIAVEEAALRDLRARLNAARWPGSIDAHGWDDGSALCFMQRLADRWIHRFDWRVQEDRLNRLSNRMMTLGDQDIHFVHQPGTGPSPMKLILTHGWPGSFAEMERVIPLLADPGLRVAPGHETSDIVLCTA